MYRFLSRFVRIALFMRVFLFSALFFLVSFSPALAWEGFVTRIIDGDTVEVLHDGKQTFKVRLYGIDCPEKHQAFGSKAKQAMADLVFNQVVEVQPMGRDRYQREIGMILLPDGTNANLRMVELGLAWVYTRYCKEDFCRDWRRAEGVASEHGLGLWSDPQPVPPWAWRRNR